jgi:hypothetical protein
MKWWVRILAVVSLLLVSACGDKLPAGGAKSDPSASSAVQTPDPEAGLSESEIEGKRRIELAQMFASLRDRSGKLIVDSEEAADLADANSIQFLVSYYAWHTRAENREAAVRARTFFKSTFDLVTGLKDAQGNSLVAEGKILSSALLVYKDFYRIDGTLFTTNDRMARLQKQLALYREATNSETKAHFYPGWEYVKQALTTSFDGGLLWPELAKNNGVEP